MERCLRTLADPATTPVRRALAHPEIRLQFAVLPFTLLLGLYWRARYTFICAALSSTASPVMSTSAFFTVPVNAKGD